MTQISKEIQILKKLVVQLFLDNIFVEKEDITAELIKFYEEAPNDGPKFEPNNLLSQHRRPYACYGIDMPFIAGNENAQKKIMIVGMEPMRRDNDYNRNSVTITTPWALHSTYNRGTISRVRKLVHLLVEQNFLVYVTDASKIYYNKNDFQNLPNILEKEIDLVYPDLIVFMGAAQERFNSYNINLATKSIKLPHPNIRQKGFGWKAETMFVDIINNL